MKSNKKLKTAINQFSRNKLLFDSYFILDKMVIDYSGRAEFRNLFDGPETKISRIIFSIRESYYIDWSNNEYLQT